jgi:hypothetical protein
VFAVAAGLRVERADRTDQGDPEHRQRQPEQPGEDAAPAELLLGLVELILQRGAVDVRHGERLALLDRVLVEPDVLGPRHEPESGAEQRDR